MVKKYWKDGLVIGLLVLLTISVFWWIPKVYFQQDEWFSIGQSLLAKIDPWIFFRVTNSVHFSPVAQFWFALQYSLFGLNAGYFSIVSLGSHMLVAILAYILLRELLVRRLPALIGITFFALNPVSSQVVSWISASEFAGPSVILFLSGCIIWIWRSPKKPWYADGIAGLLLFCAMLAKEDLIIGYAAIFLSWLLLKRSRRISYWPIFLSFIAWFLIYMSIWIFGPKGDASGNHRSISDSLIYLFHVIGGMGKIILTHDTLRAVFQGVTGRYVSYFPFIDNDPVLKIMSAFVGILWYIWYFASTWVKKIPLKKILFFPSLMIIAMFPYYFSFSTTLESRHYYVPVLISGLWVAFYIDWTIQNRYRTIKFITVAYFILLFIMFVVGNQPQKDFLPSQRKREAIVTGFQNITHISSPTTVYFIENAGKFPFQSGVGQTLIILQARHDAGLYPFIRANYLWGMFDQGYKKLGTIGFGYYNDFNELAAGYGKKLFEISVIRAYSYDENTNGFRDITNKVDRELMVQ